MMAKLHLATFRCDVTPPLGHPLCGGWIEPARGVDDPLWAVGVVLLGPAAPVVLCAVDWTGLRNEAHLAWRKALAKAAHTTPERVSVHCVHPHNTPFADTRAQQLLAEVNGPPLLDLAFFDRAVANCADAVRTALARTQSFTHIGIGQAKVEQVASNRRVLGPDGKIRFTRTSATRDPVARAEPEGLIDPYLKILAFFDGEKPLAALNYYATHPMSYYGDGRVSSDFAGLAREARAAEGERVFQCYFTGCAGNITAGKYNDGNKANRVVLRDRLLAGMRAAWKNLTRQPVDTWNWRTARLAFSPRREANFTKEGSRKILENPKASKAQRGNAALQLAWLERIGQPVELGCLEIGTASVLHLPGEAFIEYQLLAQQARKDRFVCVAAYGDGGMGYIPTDRAFLEGGYEPTVALAAPCEKLFSRAIIELLGGKKDS
jgi:hypothetical protein